MTLNTKKAVPKDLIDSLLADYKKPEDLIGENGRLKQLTKLLVRRALDAEMSDHLGLEKNAPVTNPGGNARNGKSKKTLKGEFGELPTHSGRNPKFRKKRQVKTHRDHLV
jgi:putative transposase